MVENKVLFINLQSLSRSQKGGTVKKIVRPHVVHPVSASDKKEKTETSQENCQKTDPVTTAAVAASAAVAATQPFLQVFYICVLTLHL